MHTSPLMLDHVLVKWSHFSGAFASYCVFPTFFKMHFSLPVLLLFCHLKAHTHIYVLFFIDPYPVVSMCFLACEEAPGNWRSEVCSGMH